MRTLMKLLPAPLKAAVVASAVAACTVIAVSPAGATLIAPGGSVSAASVTYPTGALLADTGLLTYSYGSPLSTGTIRELVYTDPGNPLGAGDLTFVYQVHVETGDLGRVTGSSYAGFQTDVGTATPVAPLIVTGTASPDLITRSAAGDVIGFNFSPNIVPDGGTGDTTLALIVLPYAETFRFRP